MVTDRVSFDDNYDDFGVRNMCRYRGDFKYPIFLDTDRHRTMEDYNEDFVHLRSIKTGEIFQFRLDLAPTFRKPGILITSTEKITFTVIIPGKGFPSIGHTLDVYARRGVEKPSKTAYNGIVKFGAYVKDQGAYLLQRLDLADSELTADNLYRILIYLRRRANAGE